MRFYTLVVSIVAHAAMLTIFVIVPLVAMDALPVARGIKAFIRADAAELPDPPPPPAAHASRSTPRAADPAAAPTRAPDSIQPESPAVPAPPPVNGPPGIDGGVDGGVPCAPPPAPCVGVSLPTPPTPPVVAPVRPGGNIQPPRKTVHVAPVYPAIARANKVQGLVILEAVIGENGRVRNVRVLRSIPLLDAAAVEAVRQWVFSPTLLNGEPVPVVMTVTVAFELK
jgi:protein TonB